MKLLVGLEALEELSLMCLMLSGETSLQRSTLAQDLNLLGLFHSCFEAHGKAYAQILFDVIAYIQWP